MATSEPMTDEQMAEIRQRVDGWRGDHLAKGVVYHDRELLLAEVDRLRACEQALAAADEDADETLVQAAQEMKRLKDENTRLRAENAAMRPVVEAVAIGSVIATGSANTRITGPVLFNTFADMPTLQEQARAFVAAHPATAAGEAESEGE